MKATITALRQALEVGRRREGGYQEGRRWVVTRLEEVVTLDRLGDNQTEFEVGLGEKSPANPFPSTTSLIRRGRLRRRCSEQRIADPGFRSALNASPLRAEQGSATAEASDHQ